MYKKKLENFNLASTDFESLKKFKTEINNTLTPELLDQIKNFEELISENKDYFNSLSKIYKQLYFGAALYFPDEIKYCKVFTKEHLKKEYKIFEKTQIYNNLSKKIDELSPGTNKLTQAFLIQSTFFLTVCLKFNLNSAKVFKILELVVYIFINNPDLHNIIGSTYLYVDIFSDISILVFSKQNSSEE